jgi:RNA polymerase sigma-70 factor (ECF subfamily)
LLNASHSFEQFHGHGEPELVAWLRRILANHLSNQVKQSQSQVRDHRREESLDALLDHSHHALEQALVAAGSSPSEQASRREQLVRVVDALDRLSPDQREVVMLRLVDHLPLEAIAAQRGRTVRAVTMTWARAVKRLNEILREP